MSEITQEVETAWKEFCKATKRPANGKVARAIFVAGMAYGAKLLHRQTLDVAGKVVTTCELMGSTSETSI